MEIKLAEDAWTGGPQPISAKSFYNHKRLEIWWFATDRDLVIAILLIAMAVVLAAEVIYIVIKRRRRRKEMSLFRNREPAEEPLADKAHNSVLTTESISESLARQGADTSEADSMIREAKRALAIKDYARAIERAEAAKISLLRAKRDLESEPRPAPALVPEDDADEGIPPAQQPMKKDSLPPNYMQAKFMLATARDLLEKKGVTSGEAHELYRKGAALFDREDYTAALSCATKAGQLLDSESITLIGGDAAEPKTDEAAEALACASCGSEVSVDDAFCRECGQSLAAAQECPGCGNEVDRGDKFCRKCGSKLR